MRTALLVTLAAALLLAGTTGARAADDPTTLYVDPAAGSDRTDGSKAAPLETIGKALEACSGGETIFLADGQYPAVAIGAEFPEPVTIRAANPLRAVMAAGVALDGAANVRLVGLRFAWTPETRPKQNKEPFLSIERSKGVEVADCEIADDPGRDVFTGWAVVVGDSDRVTVRDSRIHHVYFGVSFYRSTNCTARGLTIGPWSHEDGIRVMECEGPILIENCRISNAGNQGRKTGHVDALQVVHWTDNLTIRNCVIHNASQAIGAFGVRDRRRKNWRIEGNLIYDVLTPHYCTVVGTDGLEIVNNTFPQGTVRLGDVTGVVVKNNIFADGTLPVAGIEQADCNLWAEAESGGSSRKQLFGPHDTAGADPRFVNAPQFFTKCDYWGKTADGTPVKDDFTDRRVRVSESIDGKIAVGDQVELLIFDGRPRDGVLHRVTRVEGRTIEVDPPTDGSMKGHMVLIYNWGPEPASTAPDYRLRGDSPAIDSADGDAGRGKDLHGHGPTDIPDVENTGIGTPPYLDRGAFEYVDGGE